MGTGIQGSGARHCILWRPNQLLRYFLGERQIKYFLLSFFQEQARRKELIASVCKERRAELYYEMAPLFDHLFVHIPQYNMFYCGIPKAGTTTWLYGKDRASKICLFKHFLFMKKVYITITSVLQSKYLDWFTLS